MNDNPFFDAPVEKKTNKATIILQIIAILTIVILIIWILLLEQNQVKGPSMQPNFITGEFLLTSKLPKLMSPELAQTLNSDYQRGDVVIFQKPGFDDFVKRVIALPGEKIRVQGGKFYVNEKKLVENYISDSIYTNAGDFLREGSESIIVPAGNYILIGDNRPQSNDSRFGTIGFVKREWIKGKVLLRIWPLEKFTFVSQGNYTLE